MLLSELSALPSVDPIDATSNNPAGLPSLEPSNDSSKEHSSVQHQSQVWFHIYFQVKFQALYNHITPVWCLHHIQALHLQ